jgi:hypothetical protein
VSDVVLSCRCGCTELRGISGRACQVAVDPQDLVAGGDVHLGGPHHLRTSARVRPACSAHACTAQERKSGRAGERAGGGVTGGDRVWASRARQLRRPRASCSWASVGRHSRLAAAHGSRVLRRLTGGCVAPCRFELHHDAEVRSKGRHVKTRLCVCRLNPLGGSLSLFCVRRSVYCAARARCVHAGARWRVEHAGTAATSRPSRICTRS